MAQWTAFAKSIALNYLVQTEVIPAPPSLWVALFDVTADPGDDTRVEVADPTYQRQHIDSWGPSGASWGNADQLEFPVAQDGQFVGIAVYDKPVRGNCLFWHDYDITYTFVGGTSIPVPALGLLLGLTNPAVATTPTPTF